MIIKLNGNSCCSREKLNWTIVDIQRKLRMHWEINEIVGNSKQKG